MEFHVGMTVTPVNEPRLWRQMHDDCLPTYRVRQVIGARYQCCAGHHQQLLLDGLDGWASGYWFDADLVGTRVPMCHGHHDNFDAYEVAFHEDEQRKEYHCHGCEAVGYSQWPTWELIFNHLPNCRWTDAEKQAAPPVEGK